MFCFLLALALLGAGYNNTDSVVAASATVQVQAGEGTGIEADIVQCPICRREEESCDFCTRCSHHFHKTCLNSWFEIAKDNCPLCRTSISSNQLLENYFGGKMTDEDFINLDQSDPSTKDILFHYISAGKDASLIKRMVLEKELDVNLELPDANSLFELACAGFDLQTVKFLVDHGADLTLRDGRFAIIRACVNNKLDTAQYLIDQGVKVNFPGHLSPLNVVCYYGNTDSANFLIERGAKLSDPEYKGDTPLICAAQNGHYEVVKLLVTSSTEKGFDLDLNGRDSSGATALLISVQNDDLDTAKCLVEYGADMDVTDLDGNNLMHLAVINNNVDMVKYLLEVGARAGDFNVHLKSPLHKACVSTNYNFEIFKLLVDSGVDLNPQDMDDATPLMRACALGRHDMVQYLLEKGADISCVSTLKLSILETAYHVGNSETVKLLLESANQRNPKFIFPDLFKVSLKACVKGNLDLMKHLVEIGGVDINRKQYQEFGSNLNLVQNAAFFGNTDILKYLLDCDGVDLTVVDDKGNSLLNLAALTGHFGIVKILLEKTDCDANTADVEGRTPLFRACEYGSLDTVNYLLEKGANIEHRNKSGLTPIRCACVNGQLEIVKYAFEHLGMDDKSVNHSGWTYLHSACQADQVDMAKYLIERGADIKAKAVNGATPMHVAYGNESINVLKYILETYPSVCGVNDKDSRGHTLLVYAVVNNDHEMTKYLVTHGADVNVKFDNNFTALHYCALNRFNDLGKFLISSEADMYSTQKDGFTPFALAVISNNLELIRYFLTIGSISALSCGKLQDLLVAITLKGRLDMIKLLAENGADLTVTIESYMNYSLLHFAVSQKHHAMVEYLLESKLINSDVTDDNGSTPLMTACIYGDLPIVKLLIKHGANRYLGLAARQVAQLCDHLNLVQYFDDTIEPKK